MSREELKNKLWKMADDLRGSMDSSEFKNYILGLLFFKFISDKNETFYKDNLKNDNMSIIDAFNESEYKNALLQDSVESIGYSIEYKYLFSSIVKLIKENNYTNQILNNAFNNFENSSINDDLRGLFEDVDLQNSRLGSTEDEKIDKIKNIINTLNRIENEENVLSSDIMGDAYEYLISQFASSAGKKAGEFYTPQCVAKLMSKIVTDSKNNLFRVYDPTCGSGSLLLSVAHEINNLNSKNNEFVISGQELNRTTYNLARMNMIIHGIKYGDFKIRQGNTIKKPDEELAKFKYDAIVANPPYGTKWDSPKSLLEDKRFYKYGAIAPSKAMETTFLQHIEYYMSDSGKAVILLPVGVLFRKGAENKIISYLVDNRIIESVILLPKNMFYSTSISVVCIVLKKDLTNERKGIFIFNAEKIYQKNGTKNILTNNNILRIFNIYKNKEETNISKTVDFKVIEENDYNLNISKYINEIKEKNIDIDKLGLEIKQNLEKLRELETNILSDIRNIKDLLE